MSGQAASVADRRKAAIRRYPQTHAPTTTLQPRLSRQHYPLTRIPDSHHSVAITAAHPLPANMPQSTLRQVVVPFPMAGWGSTILSLLVDRGVTSLGRAQFGTIG